MPAKKEISLLPSEENANSFLSKALKWTNTVGRVIIIFTELIVISAFVSRFWLDRKNSDLSEVIRQRKAILESTQDFEKEYGLLQQRLKIIKNNYLSTPGFDQNIKSLVGSAPDDISFNQMSLSLNDKNLVNADFSTIAFKEDSIINFITNLALNPDIDVVNVLNIEKKTKENKYTIDINVVFTKKNT
jgi:hypothetical protein